MHQTKYFWLSYIKSPLHESGQSGVNYTFKGNINCLWEVCWFVCVFMVIWNTRVFSFFLLEMKKEMSCKNCSYIFTDYSETKAIRILNSELADSLGNLLNRCTATTLNPGHIFPKFCQHSFNTYCDSADASRLVDMVSALPGNFMGFLFFFSPPPPPGYCETPFLDPEILARSMVQDIWKVCVLGLFRWAITSLAEIQFYVCLICYFKSL